MSGATYETDQAAIVVAISDADGWRLMRISDDESLTVFATLSEDPQSWQEMEMIWPRYSSPPVPEFANSLPIQIVDESMVLQAIEESPDWFVVDLLRKRIVTGEGILEVSENPTYAMVSHNGEQHWPVSINLPPWWEVHEQKKPEVVQHPCAAPIQRPRPNRAVLFGQPLIADLAYRIVGIAGSERWRSDPHEQYDFTIVVHRDWLMTPREDLGGLCPREMLHGGVDWHERLVQGQQLRIPDQNCVVAMPPVPEEQDDQPMGREEICIYFDLCRELIGEGWKWCVDSPDMPLQSTIGSDQRGSLEALLQTHLEQVKSRWLEAPLEGGSPPSFILECSRRRVPRGVGLLIKGVEQREPEDHLPACDCPICEMMNEGNFGITFVGIDGHHLELDDEFAFSLCDDREEWEWQQQSIRDSLQAWEVESETQLSFTDPSEPSIDLLRSSVGLDEEELAPIWPGQNSNVPIPGDPDGHLALALKLADIMGYLQCTEAPSEQSTELNRCFREFRHATGDARAMCARQLNSALQRVAEAHPALAPKSADLQSQVDESIRRPILGDT